jgi:hypothetical protein
MINPNFEILLKEARDQERDHVLKDAINKITSQLNDRDRNWKGMMKSIKILQSLHNSKQIGD